MYKLISATPSPYARKVRIALAEKGLPFELLTEVPWDATTSLPRHNPLEKLPVLLLPDGGSVYESSYILQWLELKHPKTPLLPAEVDGILAARRLEVLCDGICDAMVLTFFERQRSEGASAPWLARQRRKIDGGLAEIARLVGEREFAVGDRFSLGDIAAGTVVGYLAVRFQELPWRDTHPNLAVLSDRLEKRPSFQASVPFAQTITDRVV
ncbi:glutathione S-transferase [Methylobacterium sp. WL103]|uniref:glutathione S-transferase family protein n=1 Tax=Methylobacterium sp. WL103 TaxID=2603891 RepID=UPI0011CBD2B2|nr:glutathione S-transferase N-terminal domain-containing protein [Methylobacterium sp. WL103]TXN08021.1 glutathione S-transferase [Methylobacterium sp. WL103]